MKTIYAVLLAVIFSIELHAQTNSYNESQHNLQPLKLKSSAGKFNETTYHIGVEYGSMFNISEKYIYQEYVHSLTGFYDIDIAEKILYFRLETGIMAEQKFIGGAGFAAIGVNYRIKKFDRHIIYLLFGLEGWTNAFSGGYFWIINPKYVFILTKGFGLSAGVSYMPWISFKPLDMGKGFVSVSAGVQFFY